MPQSSLSDYQSSDCIDYDDPEVLRRLYHEEKMSQGDIAELTDVSRTSIKRRMDKFGIEARDNGEAAAMKTRRDGALFRTNPNGYEQWVVKDVDDLTGMYVHRLLAIAELGEDEVAGNVIHHKNGIKWDNRPENIEVMTNREHSGHHGYEG
jgi:hypothetical protein